MDQKKNADRGVHYELFLTLGGERYHEAYAQGFGINGPICALRFLVTGAKLQIRLGSVVKSFQELVIFFLRDPARQAPRADF